MYTLSPDPSDIGTITDTPERKDTLTVSIDQVEKTPACDLAQAGRPFDITIPDDTPVHPGEYFSKTWRLVNAGGCTWDESYAVVWFSGADIGVSRTQNLPTIIPMGKSVDVTVDMIAPSAPGSYQSNWKLSNTAGVLFGIGPAGDAPFWVRVVVVPEDMPTVTEPTFTDTPTVPPPPPIFLAGMMMMMHDMTLNLDTGLTDSGAHADLRLDWPEGEGVQASLLPQNGARMVAMGSYLPDQNQCLNAALNDAPVSLATVESSLFLCVRTNEGLPGRILITAIDAANRQVTVDFTIWAVP